MSTADMVKGNQYQGTLVVGQEVYNILYGGHYGYITQIIGQQDPASIQHLAGGAISMGGRATMRVRWDNGHESSVPESIVRGVQWMIGGPADTAALDAEYTAAKAENERQLRAKAAEEETIRTRFTGAGAVTIGPDQMAVTVQLCYDDSDMMTDYFSTASYGPCYCLAIVKRGARTERTYRAAMQRYPELAALAWKWDTDRKELQQDGGPYISLAEITTYGGRRAPNAAWRVDVAYDAYAERLIPFAGYPGPQVLAPTAAPSTPTPTRSTPTTATPTSNPGSLTAKDGTPYTVTHERDWTWLSFASKPAGEVLDAVRGLGARWGHKRGAWYITRNEDDARIVNALAGREVFDLGARGMEMACGIA